MGTSGGIPPSDGPAPPVSQIRLAAPTLLLMLPGTGADLTVTWSTPLPTAGYQTALDTSALLGKGTAVVTAQTAAGLTLHVAATSLIAAGVQILVAGWMS